MCRVCRKDGGRRFGYCTPNPMDVCEDPHDEEPDLSDEWKVWHVNDSELEDER